jgi:IS30 family transposase
MGTGNNTTNKRTWKQITEHERHKIEALLKAAVSVKQIAELLGKDRRTIEREIARGKVSQKDTNLKEYFVYKACYASINRNAAASKKGRKTKLVTAPKAFTRYVKRKIVNEKFSPDAALANMRNKKFTFALPISTKTLYNYIDKGLVPGVTNQNLPEKRKNGKKRQYRRLVAWNNTKGDSIDNRPKEVDDRSPLHWEADCVLSGRGGHSCLLVLTERHSRHELIFKMRAHTQACVIDVLNKLELRLGEKFPLLFKTITFDNGSEFLNWQDIENSCIKPDTKRTKTYFCHPYSSWERGSNEVNNKLIRRFIKKGEIIDYFSDEDIS